MSKINAFKKNMTFLFNMTLTWYCCYWNYFCLCWVSKWNVWIVGWINNQSLHDPVPRWLMLSTTNQWKGWLELDKRSFGSLGEIVLRRNLSGHIDEILFDVRCQKFGELPILILWLAQLIHTIGKQIKRNLAKTLHTK